jgi:predicted RNA-binding protein with RPS1 domain
MIEPHLQQLKDNFIKDLKELLKNKDKKSAKKLQSDAEQLYITFKDNVSKYQKQKVKELEQKVAEVENQTLQDLDNQLKQI